MERLYAHKKATFRFWDEIVEEQKKTAFTADAAQLVASAVEWLGIYANQIPNVTPADAWLILYDWQTLWFYERCGVMI
ncbi:hypothetical protein GCM10027592_56450 [Spirosoma flavus]